MIRSDLFPILEFDSNKSAKIEPSKIRDKIDVPKVCVIAFFGEVIQQKLEQGLLKEVAKIYAETLRLPIYETVFNNNRVGITWGYPGAAGAVAQLEELIAMGFEKFIVCGGAGVLQKDVQIGHLVLPFSAVRDEGVSYHYLEPSREVECNKYALSVIEEQLKKDNVSYICLVSFILALLCFILFVMSDKPEFQNTYIAFEGLWQRLTLLFMYAPLTYIAIQNLMALSRRS